MKFVKFILLKIIEIVDNTITILKIRIFCLEFYPPNYIYYNKFNKQSVIIDVGCGHKAELSKHLIALFNLTAYGVDPTLKHAPFLQSLEETSKGNFHYLNLAVASINGLISFNESKENESGSILSDHLNVQKDEITTYTIESVNLNGLFQRVGAESIDYIKLDLEGAEYELLKNTSKEDLSPFNQIFVEFHHHCTNYTTNDTMYLVKQICSKGFKVRTLDRHNYLFYKN